MEHSKDFPKIRKWYRMGIYHEKELADFFEKGKIRQDEMEEIIAENRSRL